MSSPVKWSECTLGQFAAGQTDHFNLFSVLLSPGPGRSSSANEFLCTRCAGQLERGFATATRGLWLPPFPGAVIRLD